MLTLDTSLLSRQMVVCSPGDSAKTDSLDMATSGKFLLYPLSLTLSHKYVQYRFIKFKQVWKNNECTMDLELPDATAYASGRRIVSTHQMAALFCRLESVMSNRKSESVNRCIFA